MQKCVKDACKSCRSRQELSNEYLLANFGFDTAENESLKVYLIFKLLSMGFNFQRGTLPHNLLRGGKTYQSSLSA